MKTKYLEINSPGSLRVEGRVMIFQDAKHVETKDQCETLKISVLRLSQSSLGKTAILSLSDKQYLRTTFFSSGEKQIKTTKFQQLSFF